MTNHSALHFFLLSIRKYISIIRKAFFIVAVFVLIIQLFFALTSHDTKLAAVKSEKIKQKTRSELYKLFDNASNSKDENVRAISTSYSYVMCGMTGELCEVGQKERYTEGTVASTVGKIVSLPFENPPASGIAWISNSMQNAGFVPKSYAQGIGFSSLTSYQTIWKAMRDVTFLVLVIVIVGCGFIVMFNVPLGAKSSVTIEAMLPRLVITLLLLSFSYAIAGFLIDIMYVLMILVVTIFAPIIQGSQGEYLSASINGSPFNLLYVIWNGPIANGDIWDMSQALYGLIPSQIRYLIDSIIYFGLSHFLLSVGASATQPGAKGAAFKRGVGKVGTWVSKAQNPGLLKFITSLGSFGESAKKLASNTTSTSFNMNAIFAGANIGVPLLVLIIQMLILEPLLAALRSYITLFLLFILLLISLLFTFFKVFAMLFGTYVDIILSIMFAPIYIVLNAMPGSNAFSDWIKQLAINLLTFPIVMALLIVVSYMTQFADTTEMWTPPFLTGIASQRAIQVLVAGTILFNIPSFIEKIREMLGYKKGFSMSPLSMLSPWLALTGSVVGLAGGANTLNRTFREKGGIFGWGADRAGANPK